jgi:hypothetical protein
MRVPPITRECRYPLRAIPYSLFPIPLQATARMSEDRRSPAHPHPRRVTVSILPWLAVTAAALLAGCGGWGGSVLPGPAGIRLSIVRGNGQVALPGQVLTDSLVVRATRGGHPVSVPIRFTASAGRLNDSVRTTGPDGLAAVQWTAPGELQGARVTARLEGGSARPVVFRARRARPDELDLVLAPGAAGPVQLLVYDSGAFDPGSLFRAVFTDSLHLLPFRDPGARDEIVAFTPGRGPALVRAAWTPGRDTVLLGFPEMIRIPLTVWVVQPPFDSTVQLVRRHLQGMADTWEAQGGIGLRDLRIVDATGFPGAARYQGTGVPSCVPEIWTTIGEDAGRLNAYYLGETSFQMPDGRTVVPSAGSCDGGRIEVNPLAWQRSPNTLAHEIGHELLGGHHETLPNNVMHFRGEGSTFSPGQLFVAHYSEGSVLNTMFNAHPPSLRRPCRRGPPAPGGSPATACMSTSFVLD